MSVEFLQTLSMIGYLLSGVFLVVTIVLFFVLRVPKLINDLTGATARKAIEDIRKQNRSMGGNVVTEKIGTQNFCHTESSETTVLVNSESGVTTSLLSEISSETTVLDTAGNQSVMEQGKETKTLKIEIDIGYWESNEIIV